MSEDLGFLFALLLNGVSIGLMYSLIALGFVLVYKATDAINFAQGEFVMLAGLIVAMMLSIEWPLARRVLSRIESLSLSSLFLRGHFLPRSK